MGRLTEEALKDSYVLNPQENIPNVIVEGMIYNKLGKLEDIEEEIGIDLITLFKAVKEGFYHKVNGEIEYIEEYKSITFNIDLEFNRLCYLAGFPVFWFEEYGKTWALTKEELR